MQGSFEGGFREFGYRLHVDIEIFLGADCIRDRNRPAFGGIGVQKSLAGPAVDDSGEFPCEVGTVLYGGVHAQTPARWQPVCGVSDEETRAGLELVGDHRRQYPWRQL